MLALALVCAADVRAREAPTLEGRIVGADGAGVWLGAVGEELGEATWTLVEGGRFEIPAPPGEQVALVAITRDRVPLVVSVPDVHGGDIELALSPGLWLEGSVRSEGGRVVGGAEVRVVAADALVLDGLGLAGYPVSLLDAKLKVALGDGRALEVPPSARPAWATLGDGTFRIGGLEPGRYFLEATMLGFVPAFESHVGIREDHDNNYDVELFEAFHVAGLVVDGDGVPVAGAEVRADWVVPAPEPDWDLGGHRMTRRRAAVRTGDDGSFRLERLDAGPPLTIRAESPEFGSSKQTSIRAPYDGLVIEVGRRVARGRVVDAATGEPLKLFEIKQKAPYHNSRTTHTPRFGDGRFEILAAPGMNLVRFDAPGRVPRHAKFFVGSGEYDLGEVRLEKARTVTGRVINARSGEPVSGARVLRSSAQYRDVSLRSFVSENLRFTRTGVDGTFVLDGLPTGVNQIEVRIQGGGPHGRTVELPADVRHIEIAVGVDGVVAGSLVLPDGTPVAGTVRLWERLNGSWTSPGWRRVVDDDGAFRWTGLGDGEYRVTGRSDSGPVPNPSPTFSLRDGEHVDDVRLVVEPGGRLRGTVAGLRRGEWAYVEVRSDDDHLIKWQTLGNGAYSLEGVPDGATVDITSGSLTFRRLVAFDDQAEAQFDFDFSGSASLKGTVRAGGLPVGGIELSVVPEDRSLPTAHTATNELGRYFMQGIASGPYSVRTRAGDSFDVHVAQSAVLDIDLPPISLSGSVLVDGTGHPVTDGIVRLVRADGVDMSRPLNAPIAIDGSFQFEGLRAGEYIVRVVRPDHEDVLRHVHVARQETMELRLRRGGSGGSSVLRR